MFEGSLAVAVACLFHPFPVSHSRCAQVSIKGLQLNNKIEFTAVDGRRKGATCCTSWVDTPFLPTAELYLTCLSLC